MRALLFGAWIVAVVGVGLWLRAGGGATGTGGTATGGAPLACRWQAGDAFAFDVAIDSTLTFDEGSLVPGRSGGDDGAHEQRATAAGRLDAAVLSVNDAGLATVAARLPDWNTMPSAAETFPAIDADARRIYLLQIDDRCRVVATARPRDASVIAYRRVLGVFDHLDFALPPPGTPAATPYTTRHADDFGWATLENRYTPAGGRGRIARRRTSYDVASSSDDSLPVSVRIRATGGNVTLGDAAWFASLTEDEDVEVVANGRVPMRSRSATRITRRTPEGVDVADVAVGAYLWGRPTEAELAAAHEALHGARYAGLPAAEAVTTFLTVRDGGAPGAWHDAQRMLRDWMRGNPAGVRELSRRMSAGAYARKDQADLTLAMARSGSHAGRDELQRLASDGAASTDLRVQAASACGDLKQPTPATVATLARIAATPRDGTPADMLPSTALMSLGTIVDTAPGTPAAAQARRIVQQTIRTGSGATRAEALYAASNSGDRGFLSDAIASAGSTDTEERAAGVHAMRKMTPTGATAEVLDALMHDDVQPEVVKQIAESRRQQIQTYGGQLTAQELSLYATKLPSAPEGVRWELLRTIGEVARTQPAAQQVLVSWYRSETVRALKSLIGQYVPAGALRG